MSVSQRLWQVSRLRHHEIEIKYLLIIKKVDQSDSPPFQKKCFDFQESDKLILSAFVSSSSLFQAFSFIIICLFDH